MTPPAPTWLQAVQAELAADRALIGFSQLATPGFMARLLADADEAMIRLAHALWQKVREDLWGEAWTPWRKW